MLLLFIALLNMGLVRLSLHCSVAASIFVVLTPVVNTTHQVNTFERDECPKQFTIIDVELCISAQSAYVKQLTLQFYLRGRQVKLEQIQ